MKNKYKKMLTVFILIIVATITTGYAAFGSEILVSNIVAEVRLSADIRLTSIAYSSATNEAHPSYENYDVESIVGEATLPNSTSTITYKVGVTNFGNIDMGIYSISGLPSNLTYEITDYSLHDKLCDSTGKCSLGATKNFYITIKYATGGYNASQTKYNFKLDFEFRKMHTITYTGITNNNYPPSVIDGGNLKFTATSNIPPKIIAFNSAGDRYNYNLYSYVNGVFTFNNVTSDINLKYQEKAYLAYLANDTLFKSSEYKTIIDSVYFVDYVDTSGAIEKFDLTSSASTPNDIVGWITSGNDLYIGSDWNIYGKDLTQIFNNMSGIKTISFGNFNTSEATTMYYMFKGCSGLTSLDVSSFDTSNVTNMGRMFHGVSNVSSIDVSGFDTSQVTKMHGMFREMSSLTSLDLSNFKTDKLIDMYEMFWGASKLETLDLSNFKTDKVLSLYQTFGQMTNLKSLDLSNFNTSKVKKLTQLFYNNESLSSVNLSSFNTSMVTMMDSVFSGCTSLTSLDLSHFDTSNVTDMKYMFYNNMNLTYLNIDNFNTSNVTNMEYMFHGLHNLENLDVSKFNTSNVTLMNNMFAYMYNLKSINVSNFDTSKVTSMKRMFEGLKSIRQIDVSSFNTSNVVHAYYMFASCNNITKLDLSNFDTSNFTNLNAMFSGCTKLTSLDLRSADFDNAVEYLELLTGVPANINIVVKDSAAQTFIQNALEAGKGTVTIATA